MHFFLSRSITALLPLALPSLWIAVASDARSAPIFETVQGFALGPQYPACKPVWDTHGNIYGTTHTGGGYHRGTVFKTSPNGTVAVIHHFRIADGADPVASLTLGADGNFYGVTETGGGSDLGVVYRITPTGDYSVLHEFSGGEDGGTPNSRLLQSPSGDFYGTTYQGGAHGLGTFFKITPTGTLTPLVHWDNDAVGWNTAGDLIQGNDGNFYGTNQHDNVPGHGEAGTIFRITPSGTATLVASFANVPTMDFSFPMGVTQASDGNFYGTSMYGGADHNGTIFKVTPEGAISLLAQFGPSESNIPTGQLAEGSDHQLYGASHGGGSYGGGTIFKISTSGVYTLLSSIEPSSGDPTGPWAGLVPGPNGAFYGTSENGGDTERGTVFKTTSKGVISVVASLNGDPSHRPSSQLLQTNDGGFYGTTSFGGYANNGIFKMSPSGNLSIVVDSSISSSGVDFYKPSFVQGKDRNIYGAGYLDTPTGGFFKIKPSGQTSTIFPFDDESGTGPNSLIKGRDGNLYGTAGGGGSNFAGSIFRLTLDGSYTTLASFNSDSAQSPNPGLTEASDGNFYGTTFSGGISGTVFKMTPAGQLTTLLEFTDPEVNGRGVNSGVTEGSDGNFYGVMPWGGPSDAGSVYKVSPTGEFTLLAAFTGDNGILPVGQLLEGPDGAFYGTTSYGGGPNDEGTVFRITKTGDLTTIFHFDTIHGAHPLAGLTRGKDGSLYGTTAEGGITSNGEPAGGGQIFRIRFDAEDFSRPRISVSPTSATVVTSVNHQGFLENVVSQYASSASFRNSITVPISNIQVGSNRVTAETTITNLAPNTTYYFRMVAKDAGDSNAIEGKIATFTTAKSCKAK